MIIKLQNHRNNFITEVMQLIPTLRNVSSWLLRASTLSLSALPKGRSGNIFFGPLTSEIHNIDWQWCVCLGILKFKGQLKQSIITYSWLLSWLQASPLNVFASWGTRCISCWQYDRKQVAECRCFLLQPLSQTVKQKVEGNVWWPIIHIQISVKH